MPAAFTQPEASTLADLCTAPCNIITLFYGELYDGRGHFMPVSACHLCLWSVGLTCLNSLSCCALCEDHLEVCLLRKETLCKIFFPPRLFQQLCGFLRLLDCSLLPSWSPPSPSPSSIAICQAKSRTSSRICNSRGGRIPANDELAY